MGDFHLQNYETIKNFHIKEKKTAYCSDCRQPMKLIKVINRSEAIFKCKKCNKKYQVAFDIPTFPECINRFNWGAFGLLPLWGLGNGKSYLFFLYLPIIFTLQENIIVTLLSVIFLIIAIYYGINGNRISWMNKNWSSIEVFDRVQKRWNVAGILGLIISVISLII